MRLCHQGAAPGRGPEAKVSTLLSQFPTDADLHSQAGTVPTDHHQEPGHAIPGTHHISSGTRPSIPVTPFRRVIKKRDIFNTE